MAIGTTRALEYPTSDGKPMAETERHLRNMIDLIEVLRSWYAADPLTYVCGNMLMYYQEGNPRKHVSPDVFVVRGISKEIRDYYLVWKEGKGPDVVIELTSKSTAKEDLKTKFKLYQDVLGVRELFLFDPYEEYLSPSMQGFRLENGTYVAIDPIAGRLQSQVLGLQLDRDGWQLRLFDQQTNGWLPTPQEQLIAMEAELKRLRAEVQRKNGSN